MLIGSLSHCRLAENYNAERPGAKSALAEFAKVAVLRRQKSTVVLPVQTFKTVSVEPSAAELAVHGIWIVANICKGFHTEVLHKESGDEIRDWCEYSEIEMLSMARSSLLDPIIAIALAQKQKSHAAAALSRRRNLNAQSAMGGYGAQAGIVQSHTLTLVKIMGSLCKLRRGSSPPLLQQLLELTEGVLEKLIKKFAGAVEADLSDLTNDAFKALCGGVDKDACLADSLMMLDLHTPEKARIFERAMECSDGKLTDLLGRTCTICTEEIGDGEQVVIACHAYHSHCITPWLVQHDTCPDCRSALTGAMKTHVVGTVDAAELQASRPGRLQAARTVRVHLLPEPVHEAAKSVSMLRALVSGQAATEVPSCSSKLKALLSMLQGQHSEVCVEPTEKVLVYSMLEAALQKVKQLLESCQPPIKCFVLKKGADANAFRSDDEVRVLLIKASLSNRSTGAAGLDLPIATKVFLLDEMPCDLRAQCVDRVHRIGQTKETQIITISAAGSVDEPLRRVYNDLHTAGRGATLGMADLKDVFQTTLTLTTGRLTELVGPDAAVQGAVEEEAVEEATMEEEVVEVVVEEAVEAEDGDSALVSEEEEAVPEEDEEVDAEEAAEDAAEGEAAMEPEPPAKKRKRVADWDEAEVSAFARELKLSEQVCTSLEENLVNGEMLLAVSDEDVIKEIGMTVLQVKRLRLEVNKLLLMA